MTTNKNSARRYVKGQESAEAILLAAKNIVTKHGWDSLSISAVAHEAGIYRTAVSYHYGNKEGLIEALLETIIYEAADRLAASISSRPLGDARVVETIRGLQDLGGHDVQVVLIEALPHLVREDAYRKRLARIYQDAASIASSALGAHGRSSSEQMDAYSRALIAFLDGLLIQQLIEPEYDYEPLMEAFTKMLVPRVAALLGYASSDSERG